jgi:hypothetical protein
MAATDKTPPEPAEAGLPTAIAAIRDELETVRAGLRRIEAQVGMLEQQEPQAQTKERPRRYYEVLAAVYDRGGRRGLDADAFGHVGELHGYDRRGLGGFFTGVRAPLRRHEDRVTLSVYGERLLDSFLQDLGEDGDR